MFPINIGQGNINIAFIFCFNVDETLKTLMKYIRILETHFFCNFIYLPKILFFFINDKI